MKLEQPQIDWLTKLDKKAAGQKNVDERTALKLTLAGKIFGDREKQAASIFSGSSLKVMDQKSGRAQDTLQYAVRDQTEEFDLDEQRDGFRIARSVKDDSVLGRLLGRQKLEVEEWDPESGRQEQFEKHLNTARQVDEMALQFEEVMVDKLDEDGQPLYDKDGKPLKEPLFTEDEIAADVYDPLVRQGLMPETSVPDKYSRTKEMLKGSFEAYQERLKKEDQKSWWDENGTLTLTVIKSAISLGGTGQEVAKAELATKPESPFSWDDAKDLKSLSESLRITPGDDGELASIGEQAATIYGFCEQGFEVAADLVYENVKEHIEEREEEANKKLDDRESGATRIKEAPKLATAVVSSIAAPLGTALSTTGLGIIASSTFSALVKSGAIAKELTADKVSANNITSIRDVLNAGLKGTFEALDPGEADVKAAIKNAVTAAQGAINQHVKGELAESLNKGEVEELLSAATQAGNAIKDAVGKNLSLIVALNKHGDAVKNKAAEQLEKQFFEKDEVPADQKNDHATKHKDHAADWVQLAGKWKCTTCEASKDDASILAGILEAKIKKMKHDQKVLKLLTGVGGMAFDVASNFLAPLAIAGSLISIFKNGKEAVSRASDFLAFSQDRAAMLRAASAYSAPLSQFIDNAYFQGLYYTISVATDGLKIVAGILQCTPAVAVGTGLSAGASAAQAIVDVLNEIKKRVDLETAWKTYKKAIERPESRKDGLIAMKKNPTLAKHAIAWGAVVKEDPLVGDFMHSCGLDAATLRDPKKNIELVVAYLETRMPDDNIVVGGEKRRGIGAS